MIKIKFYFFIILFFLLLVSSKAKASTLSFQANKEDVSIGDTFFVDVKINDLKNGCVNTAQIELDFPKDKLSLVDFYSGNSFLSIWMENPSSENVKKFNEQGNFRFVGGIPGGYCGIIPGDPGDSNILGRIFFQVNDESKSVGQNLNIDFQNSSKILLNDGLGTEDELIFENFSLVIKEKKQEVENALENQMSLDNVSPEPFIIYLQKNNSMFDGDYYVEFNAIDRQTGIDHYEILELRNNEEVNIPARRTFWDHLFAKNRFIPKWKLAESPYRLEDQTLSSVVSVKAIDKTGNSRIEDYVPPVSQQKQIKIVSRFEFWMIILGVIGIAILIVIAIVFFKNKKSKIKNQNF